MSTRQRVRARVVRQAAPDEARGPVVLRLRLTTVKKPENDDRLSTNQSLANLKSISVFRPTQSSSSQLNPTYRAAEEHCGASTLISMT